MRSRVLFALTLVAALPVRAAEITLESEAQKTVYALGLSMARNLQALNLSEAELDLVKAGLTDGVLARPPKVPLNTYGPKIQALAKERQTAGAEVEKKASEAFLAEATAEKGAVRTESGLVIKEIVPGKGASPKPENTVKVHYHGTLRDGAVFDSSVERKSPATFALNQVIPCWTEGVQKMKVGGKSKLVCPSKIAYGDRGAPPMIKPGATLVFEVELLEIVK